MSDRFKKLEMIKSNANHTRETVADLELKLQKLTEEEAPLEERQNLQRRIDEMKKEKSGNDDHDHHDHHHDHHDKSDDDKDHHHEHHHGDHHSIEKGASKFHDHSKLGHKKHH